MIAIILFCFLFVSNALAVSKKEYQNPGYKKSYQVPLETQTMNFLIRNSHVVNLYKGFEFYIGMMATTQAALTNPGNYPNSDRIGSTASGDLVISKKISPTDLLLFHFETAWSPGLDGEEPFGSALFGMVNYDAFAEYNVHIDVPDAYYEGKFFDEKFDIILGRMDPTILFDDNLVANDETTQFLNGGFRNNGTIDFPGYTFGGKIEILPSELLYISLGVYDSPEKSHDFVKGIFYMGEIGFKPDFSGLIGNYRLYGWGNGGNCGAARKPGWGVGTSIDQEVVDNVSFFVRAGHSRKDAFTNYLSLSGGMGINGALYNREHDMIGLAYGLAFDNSDFNTNRNAHAIELFYRLILIKGHLQISPDIQYLINPSGSAGDRNVLLGALRLVLDL